ncbi:MAG: type IV secretion system protein VirB10 [Methylocystis sp.]|uniref:type IV secretion system protein VirB10 n=1 Tax=Methylocystis sp. TaxID=1911079 RepID=UPI000D4BDC2E|nr:type IV secretion system protein VirB10 [Methylocystis sp.]PPD10219.1 MAG: type IV secretion system protein VirB10 [Methylocystis sp.]
MNEDPAPGPLDQERRITPVSSVGDAQLPWRKGLGVIGLVTLCGLVLWASWKRTPAEVEARQKPTISVANAFERPRDPPIARMEPVALPVAIPATAERSKADELMDSARRAPVLAFNRPPQARSGAPTVPFPDVDAEPTGSIYANGYGASEARNELASNLRPTAIEGVRAARLPNRHLMVTQGTAIPCVLETAMSSDVAGFVSCVVERDVMSDSGQVVLMEKGTQIVGEYRSTLRRGSRRMFVLWTRAKTPTGVIVALSSPATDALGRSGFDGEIDNHFFERFGGALLLSIVNDAGQIAATRLSQANVQVNSIQNSGQGAAAIATEQSINIPPTLYKNQGELVSVFVARDLDFSSVYRLRIIEGRTQILDRAIAGGILGPQRITKP